ncbi:hypothetical protein KM043_004446 [Ampulex compressa]|nr:hypothetical protein KM043_004446 [Ampulex compressa]
MVPVFARPLPVAHGRFTPAKSVEARPLPPTWWDREVRDTGARGSSVQGSPWMRPTASGIGLECSGPRKRATRRFSRLGAPAGLLAARHVEFGRRGSVRVLLRWENETLLHLWISPGKGFLDREILWIRGFVRGAPRSRERERESAALYWSPGEFDVGNTGEDILEDPETKELGSTCRAEPVIRIGRTSGRLRSVSGTRSALKKRLEKGRRLDWLMRSLSNPGTGFFVFPAHVSYLPTEFRARSDIKDSLRRLAVLIRSVEFIAGEEFRFFSPRRKLQAEETLIDQPLLGSPPLPRSIEPSDRILGKSRKSRCPIGSRIGGANELELELERFTDSGKITELD